MQPSELDLYGNEKEVTRYSAALLCFVGNLLFWIIALELFGQFAQENC